MASVKACGTRPNHIGLFCAHQMASCRIGGNADQGAISPEGETFEDWMTALRPHYMDSHADVMNDSSKGQEEMEQWMAENRARFDAA